MKIDEAIENYIRYITAVRRLASRTVDIYSQSLFQLKNFLGANNIYDVEDITASDIRSWQVELIDQNMKPRTIANKLAAARSWYRFLRQQSLVDHDIMGKVQSPKEKKKLPVFFRESEVQHIYNAESFTDDFEGMRDQLLLRTLYETGMRRSELTSLKETSVSFAQKSIKVLGKRSKERIIPIEDELLNEIEKYIDLKRQITDNDALFVRANGKTISVSDVYRIVEKYMSVWSVSEKTSPHVFRHTFATHMLNEGADINAIKELLGHTDLMATEVYTHVTLKHLKDTYKHTHPRANKKKG